VVVVAFGANIRLVLLKSAMSAQAGGYGCSARALYVNGVVVVAVVSVAAISGIPEVASAARGIVYGWFGDARCWSLWLLVFGGL